MYGEPKGASEVLIPGSRGVMTGRNGALEKEELKLGGMDVTGGSLKEGRGKETNEWGLKMVRRFQAVLYNATGASVSCLLNTMDLIS